jgi:mannose-6-phosphate isomerase-like protein (cupin superfamily)
MKSSWLLNWYRYTGYFLLLVNFYVRPSNIQLVFSMLSATIMNLRDPRNLNRWIVGTPPDVSASSEFYSEQIQIAHVKNPERKFFSSVQVEHWHTSPIEEYILLLEGTLKVKVDSDIITLEPMHLLKIPPKVPHKILDYSTPLQYFLLRTPISTAETKVITE